jgi:hypothetical protein
MEENNEGHGMRDRQMEEDIMMSAMKEPVQ